MVTKIRTEDDVIIDCTNRAIRETSLTLDLFSAHTLVPALENAGILEYNKFDTTDDYTRWRTRSGVQFHRVMRGTTKFPMAWKWPWVDSLPEPYKTECRRELFSLAGALDIPLPTYEPFSTPGGSKSRLSQIMLEFSEVMAAAAPAQDGMIDDADNKESLKKYADEMLDVIEELERERRAISSIVDISTRKKD